MAWLFSSRFTTPVLLSISKLSDVRMLPKSPRPENALSAFARDETVAVDHSLVASTRQAIPPGFRGVGSQLIFFTFVGAKFSKTL